MCARDWFPRTGPPRCHQTGLLEFAGIHIDMIVRGLLSVDVSVRFCTRVMMSAVTVEDRAITMTTAVRAWDNDTEIPEWLQFVSHWAELRSPSIRGCLPIDGCSWIGVTHHIWIVHTPRRSLGVQQMTGSLLHEDSLPIVCWLTRLCGYSPCVSTPVQRFCVNSLLHFAPVCVCQIFQWDSVLCAMATGNSRLETFVSMY